VTPRNQAAQRIAAAFFGNPMRGRRLRIQRAGGFFQVSNNRATVLADAIAS
jgi:hypothetical protein